MKRRALLTTGAALLLLSTAYITVRFQTTKMADHEIDSFFANFSTGEHPRFGEDLGFLPQSRDEALALISRHSDALRNYAYDRATPELNLLLDTTSVEVSWHLRIVFSRHGTRWVPAYFDEFQAAPTKA